MARFDDKEKALILRRQEKSYSQIKKILKVSKSTLSLWLRDYPLSKQRIRELRDWNEQRIERYRETMRQKREKRLKGFYNQQKRLVFPLNKRDVYLAGLFLYWGEGSKRRRTNLSLANTDPSLIKFFISWLTKSLKINREKIRIQLHLYSDMEIEKEIQFWSQRLNVPYSQFTRPYIKQTLAKDINRKGGFGHGTCNIRIGDTRLAEKTLMTIKAIADKYSNMRT